MSTSPESPQEPGKLQRRLGGDDLRALRERMRRHFERGAADAERSVLHLTRLTATEYEAVALLLGLPSRATKSVRIDIADFDAALRRAGMADSLRQALETIDGPLVHRAMERATNDARWAAVLYTVDRDAKLAGWLATATAQGTLKRLTRQDTGAATKLLDQADVVLRRLPAGGVTRAQLAAETLGSAHALDGGRPVATVVLAALRHDAKQDTPELEDPSSVDEADHTERPADRARDTWALAGVLVNELARPALYLNLPALPQAPGEAGQPGYLSLRRLLRTTTAWAVAGRDVYVCENPNIVAIAADRWGAACAPLVCTEGMPAAAQRVLLTQLAHAGAILRYHGDFDWAGIHIANHVIRSFSAQPWRFGSRDYTEATAAMAQHARDLDGIGVEASWDGSLAEHMRRHGIAIEEEAVAASLMEDLGTAAGSQRANA